MHDSSFVKAETFVSEYAPQKGAGGGPVRVLEIGSKSYHTQDTYRLLFPEPRFSYAGLDLEPGENVDIVPANPFVWTELADNSFDICVSGQTFEHNPYFWITFAEIARVLVPGGLALIVAPGGGAVHRYPFDCWRFYPDSWASLCAATGLELVESYFETDRFAASAKGGHWRDSAAIMRKPMLEGTALDAFHRRLGLMVQLFREEPMRMPSTELPQGRWVESYQREMSRRSPMSIRKALRRLLAGRLAKIYR
jgi:SAM-dependent methyltransferase